jgi:hypothetical protein
LVLKNPQAGLGANHYLDNPQHKAGGFISRRTTRSLYPMARTCAILSKNKGFPDGKKEAKMSLNAYGIRGSKFFEKAGN